MKTSTLICSMVALIATSFAAQAQQTVSLTSSAQLRTDPAFSENSFFPDYPVSPSGNSVTVNGYNVGDLEIIFGGIGNSAASAAISSSNNSVVVKNSTVSSTGDAFIFGGFAEHNLYAARSNNNSVTVDNSNVSGGGFAYNEIYGGYAHSGWDGTSASNNSVVITDCNIGGTDIFGGYAHPCTTAVASDNDVVVKDSRVSYVYGGNSEFRATNNTVTLEGAVDVKYDIHGGFSTTGSDAFTGNTLIVRPSSSGISVGGIYHFEKYSFTLPTTVPSSGALVTTTTAMLNDISSTGSVVTDIFLGTNIDITVGSRVVLIKASSLVDGTYTAYNDVTPVTIVSDDGYRKATWDIYLNAAGDELYAVLMNIVGTRDLELIYDFGTRTEGYKPIPSKGFEMTYKGSATVALGANSPFEITGYDNDSVYVHPRTDLPVGTYRDTIIITSPIDPVRKIIVLFEVVERNDDVVIARRLIIIAAPNLTTEPAPGLYYVRSGEPFTFTIIPMNGLALDKSLRITTGNELLDTHDGVRYKWNDDGSVAVTLAEVRSPITIDLSAITAITASDAIALTAVWSPAAGTIAISATTPTAARIYNAAGALVATTTVNGTATVRLASGFYVVSLGGKQYKIVVR